ncbi:MAG: hypothetical protein Q9171_004970 [Xanthocarpia ochracea]
MGSTTPEQQATSLYERAGVTLEKKGESVTEAEVAKVFDSLKPLASADLLIGSWNGAGVKTGHKTAENLMRVRWVGNDFRGVDDVNPIMVLNDKDQRVWGEEWGHASLRKMVFRRVTSIAMIYDTQPIFDHFRYVNEDFVMGARDFPKLMGTQGTFYFYLSRRKGGD